MNDFLFCSTVIILIGQGSAETASSQVPDKSTA